MHVNLQIKYNRYDDQIEIECLIKPKSMLTQHELYCIICLCLAHFLPDWQPENII